MTVLSLVASALLAALSTGQEPAPVADAAPFTGFLKLKQKDGTLTYEITVLRGKVTSGVQGHEGSREVGADIVGGWYDRNRLVLMVQLRSDNIQDPWASHIHHFKKSADGFDIVSTLFGFGQNADDGKVYRPHVVVRQIEIKDE